MNPMRTLSLAKRAIPAVLVLLGSSTTVLAATEADESASTESTPKTAPTTQASTDTPKPAPQVSSEPGPVVELPKPAAEPQPAADPASITEVGIQRLPGSAYPEPYTRGLEYGSLSLTFHGLQWPYMPAAPGASRFVVGISGWGWVDTSYQKFSPWGNNSNISSDREAYWIQQARLVFRVTPTYSLGNGWFVQGQAELVGTENQIIDRGQTGGADTDDLWLRIGKWNTWDFTIGRYEGWEVFHLGMGLDLNTLERAGALGKGDAGQYGLNPAFYGLTDNQYRPQGQLGNAAVHYYPTRYLRFELLSTVGTNGSGNKEVAVRPVAIFDLGWIKLKAGTEYQTYSSWTPTTDKSSGTKRGLGGAIQFVFQPHIEFGLNAAQGTQQVIDNKNNRVPASDVTRTSLGLFANLSNGSHTHPLMFGIGSVYTHYVDQNNLLSPQVDDYWQLQNFVAVQYVAFSQLYIKLVAGYARGHWHTDNPLVYDDDMYSVRLRFALYF